MKALMRVRAYWERGSRKFFNELSVILAKIGWMVAPSPYDAAGSRRTNLDLRGVNSAKGAVGIDTDRAALTADRGTVAAKFISTFAGASQ